ncbi:MAG: diguanylate cyclase [Candidatus Riflebacteria bacterium]|nr:diguanylate cyclase [Candidatus Riflebacteria bacterium]
MNSGYRSYRGKLLGFLFLAILLPLLLFALISGHQARTLSYGDFVRFTEGQLTAVDDNLATFLKGVEEDAVQLAADPTVRKADASIASYLDATGPDDTILMTPSRAGGIEAEIFGLYQRFGQAHPQTAFLYLGLENGSYVQWPEGKTKGHYDPRGRPWYRQALASPDRPTRTKAYDGGAANKVIVSTVMAIRGHDGAVIGVQGVDVDLDLLTTLAEKARVGRRGFLIITEDDGTVIAHSRDPACNFQPLRAWDPVLAQAVASGAPFVQTMRDGVLYSGIIRTSPFSNWTFIGMVEDAELRESSAILGTHLVVTFLVVGLVFLLLSAGLTRTFSRPIFLLIDRLQEIGNGRFDVDIPADLRARPDELGILARAGEALRANLSDQIGKLETLNQAARLLVSTLDWQQTLEYSANIIMAVAHAERVVILLAERDESRFEVAIARGIEGLTEVAGKYAPAADRFPLAIGFSEFERLRHAPSVLKGGAAGEPGPDDGPFLRAWQAATGCPTALPLQVKNRLIGLILLDARNEDAEFVTTVARQVASSLENSRLFHDAITDGLTGLFLHRYFQMQLAREIKRSARYGSAVSLLMIDIDHFKRFNDTWGHQTGDRVLRGVARTVVKSIREVDLACRYGGEELAVILPETNLRQAGIVGEKIRRAVERESYVAEAQVTVSIGAAEAAVTAAGAAGVSGEELIRAADQCLYKAKESGRNRVVAGQEEGGPPVVAP